MASLINELIDVLGKELEIYNNLVPVVREKTQVIVKDDITVLQEITAKEQESIDQITALENKRIRVMEDISIVLGKKDEKMNLSTLISLLDQQE